MSYIPKNAKKLLNNAKLMRQYALKPYGFTIPQNCNFPKSQPQYKFFQKKMVLHRPGPTQKIQANTLVFKVDEQMSKPQIKQYLEKLYGLKIQKVNTARFMGKVVRNHLRKPSLTKSFKKAFIIADHKLFSDDLYFYKQLFTIFNKILIRQHTKKLTQETNNQATYIGNHQKFLNQITITLSSYMIVQAQVFYHLIFPCQNKTCVQEQLGQLDGQTNYYYRYQEEMLKKVVYRHMIGCCFNPKQAKMNTFSNIQNYWGNRILSKLQKMENIEKNCHFTQCSSTEMRKMTKDCNSFECLTRQNMNQMFLSDIINQDPNHFNQLNTHLNCCFLARPCIQTSFTPFNQYLLSFYEGMIFGKKLSNSTTSFNHNNQVNSLQKTNQTTHKKNNYLISSNQQKKLSISKAELGIQTERIIIQYLLKYQKSCHISIGDKQFITNSLQPFLHFLGKQIKLQVNLQKIIKKLKDPSNKGIIAIPLTRKQMQQFNKGGQITELSPNSPSFDFLLLFRDQMGIWIKSFDITVLGSKSLIKQKSSRASKLIKKLLRASNIHIYSWDHIIVSKSEKNNNRTSKSQNLRFKKRCTKINITLEDIKTLKINEWPQISSTWLEK